METVYVDKNAALVAECCKGNRKAQFELYKLYAKVMYNVALRIVNHQAEAEDILQESFLDAFNRITNFRGETTFGLWLKRIVINRSISYLRRRKADVVSLEEIEVAEEFEVDDGEIQFKVEKIKKAMAELPDGCRVILTLYLFEGYDHEEIAHILKIAVSTSRTQFMRAKNKLYRLLVSKEEER